MIKLKFVDLLAFLFPQIDTNIRKSQISDWISQTPMNILRQFINDNPAINPGKFGYDQIQNGRHIVIVVCSNWHNIWKLCPSRWISQTPINIFLRESTHVLTTLHLRLSCHYSCEVWSWSTKNLLTFWHFCLLKLVKNIRKSQISGWISQTPMNFFLAIDMHELQSCKLILWSLVMIKLKIVNFLSFLFG